MYFYVLVVLHTIAVGFWAGSLFYGTFSIHRDRKLIEEPDTEFTRFQEFVERLRSVHLICSSLVLTTGVLMLPHLQFRREVRTVGLTIAVLGWITLTALSAGTIPSTSYSSRPEDIQEKEWEELRPERQFRIFVFGSVGAVVFLLAELILLTT